MYVCTLYESCMRLWTWSFFIFLEQSLANQNFSKISYPCRYFVPPWPSRVPFVDHESILDRAKRGFAAFFYARPFLRGYLVVGINKSNPLRVLEHGQVKGFEPMNGLVLLKLYVESARSIDPQEVHLFIHTAKYSSLTTKDRESLAASGLSRYRAKIIEWGFFARWIFQFSRYLPLHSKQ
jgi:hypothetical protein